MIFHGDNANAFEYDEGVFEGTSEDKIVVYDDRSSVIMVSGNSSLLLQDIP